MEQVVEGGIGLDISEGELRRLQAPAESTREHVPHGDAAGAERRAQAARVLAPLLGEIALARAVLHAKAVRITDARRGDRVPQEHHLPAVLQERPQRLARRGRRGERYEQRQGDRRQAADHSITPRRPLWLPMYQSRPSASTIIFLMPTFLEGSSKTRSCSVRGSRRTTVSVWISFTHTIPAPSTVTAYAPPFGPAGNAYSLTTF